MNNAWQVAKTVFLRLRFIFVFVVIGLIVGNWAWIKNVVDRLVPHPPADTATEGGKSPGRPAFSTEAR